MVRLYSDQCMVFNCLRKANLGGIFGAERAESDEKKCVEVSIA